MLKYLTKISMDIFPSVIATIIGAYIVNHYINAKPAADIPAAAVAPAHTGKDAKPAEVANLPAPGVKAKGISEKSVLDRPAAEKPDKAAEQPAENKPAEAAPAETAAAPAAPRGRPSASRDKAMAKATTAPVVAAPVATAPVADANPPAASATPDANDLARAAIERLRKSPEGGWQETARAPEAPRVQESSRPVTAAPPAVRPLPPPITVSTPGPESYGSPTAANPPYTASVGPDDANRLTPPADIPVPVVVAPPLDLRADAAGPMPRPRTNVADEMLSGVKSMFHAVLPKGVTPD
jgi:hypothetical protein